MSVPFDHLIIGEVVTTDTILHNAYIGIRGETIAAIGQGSLPPAREVLDYTGRLILPGLVDGHMHTSSAAGWSGIEGATRSAAAGGVTTCVDMPYDIPHPVTDVRLLTEKIGWLERTAHVDMALYGTIKKRDGIDAIAPLAAAGVSASSFRPTSMTRCASPASIRRRWLPLSARSPRPACRLRSTTKTRNWSTP